MTKRDFEMIAAALRDTRPLPSREPGERVRWLEIVDTFASRLGRSNPAFDRERFTAACGRNT
jgi:hypothetical protein